MDRTLIESALQLKPADRLRLLEIIYSSLERPDAAMDNIWYDEAERRLTAFKAGKTQGIPADEVLGQRPRP